MAHREHAVRDDPGKSDGSGEVLVLVERVLVPRSVRVSLDVTAGHDTGGGRDLVAHVEVLEPEGRLRHHAARSIIVARARTTSSPPRSRSSVSIVRNPFPAFCRIEAIRERTVSTSPIRNARRHSYSCSAWTTGVKSRPSPASP